MYGFVLIDEWTINANIALYDYLTYWICRWLRCWLSSV